MCGIFAYILQQNVHKNWITQKECYKRVELLKPRGPDRFQHTTPVPNVFIGFQRLSIVDLSKNGDQPFTDKNKNATLVCNGEIYNSKYLTKKYNLPVNSKSDCEVILYLYLKFGIKKTLEKLDGVFAFVIYDHNRNEILAARDSYGVRPLFLSITNEHIVLSSELKSLYGLRNVKVFPNGCYWFSKKSTDFYIFNYFITFIHSLNVVF